MKRLFLIALCVLPFLQGCFITKSPGFHSGYNDLTEQQRNKVQFIPAGHAIPASNANTIYAINAQSLLGAMQDSDTTLVYIWSPHCHSKNCASLKGVEAFCNSKGYNLYVVAAYYDMDQIDVQPQLLNPLLSINHKVYKTDYCPKYVRLFKSDLQQGKAIPDTNKYGRYYLFQGRNLMRVMNSL